MLRTRMTALFLLAAIAAMCIIPAMGEPKAAEHWKITGMKVKMFSQEDGELRDVDLMNVITSSANAPLHPILVVVEVNGNPDPSNGYKVQLTAKEKGKQIFIKANATSFAGNGDKFYVPFWIDGYRCEPVTLTARVVGQRPASTMTKTIKFDCGE
ncbi:MAG: hypothetical protein QOJ02_3051 [Acidobacteriota bacterium]|nr:hypothetical protein [Acidobacteriota bacterium]